MVIDFPRIGQFIEISLNISHQFKPGSSTPIFFTFFTYSTMGSTASKPTETKVFTPKANVELGSSLINELEKSPEVSIQRLHHL